MSSPAKEQLVRRMAQAEQMRTVFGKTVTWDPGLDEGATVPVYGTFCFTANIDPAPGPGVTDVTTDGVKPDHEIEVPDGSDSGNV